MRSLVSLLEQPNPEDPLMTDIAELYTTDLAKFQKTAKEYTKKVKVILRSVGLSRPEGFIIDQVLSLFLACLVNAARTLSIKRSIRNPRDD